MREGWNRMMEREGEPEVSAMKIAIDLGAADTFCFEDGVTGVDRSTAFEEEDGGARTCKQPIKREDGNELGTFSSWARRKEEESKRGRKD
jgi:hypothetical protein